MPGKTRLSYVLVTPAHNEEATIEKTIQSMVVQSVLPKAWVIVSDGSIDKTDDIVRRYSEENPWIVYVRLPEHRDRQFAAKVHAFNAGYQRLLDFDYDVIGNLDADATFDADYFDYLTDRFEEDPSLGVAGTAFVENGRQSYDYGFTNIEHVTGIIQLFRKECFSDIGGYTPVEHGGIDWIAVTTARMRGWKTRTFLERSYVHHRRMGTAAGGIVRARYHYGEKDYCLGGSLLWEMARTLYQVGKKPYIVGGFALLAGYVMAMVRRLERPISQELMEFHRNEQMQRLRAQFRRIEFFASKEKTFP